MEAAADLYFTRWTPEAGGPHPVRIHDTDGGRRIELLRPEGPETFDTAKAFMTTLHGESYADRHWSVDRYFSRGRYARARYRRGTREPGLTIVGGFRVESSNEVLGCCVETRDRGPVGAPTPTPITVVTRRPRGIDLDARGHEVSKLLWAGFHGWINAAGYDFEDVLQEVYRKILVANQGKSPWDPTKSSFGHYVHMVCRSALSNFHRKHARVAAHERPGIPGLRPDGSWGEVDVRDSGRRGIDPNIALRPMNDPCEDLQRYILNGPYQGHPYAPLAARLVPFVHAGFTMKDSAARLGVERTSVSSAMSLLRKCAQGWAN